MKKKDFKRCPRCDHKVPFYQDRCDNCGLIFSRLSKASNTAAKVALKKKEYNKVILDSVLPVDVNKWRLFFIALFFGWFGMHYFKVGRYKVFAYMIVSTVLVYIASFLPVTWFDHEYLFMLMWALILPASISTIIWLVSVVKIAFNGFKVPIAIDENLVKGSLDKTLVSEIMEETKEIRKQKEIEEQNKKENLKVKRQKIKVVCASCGYFVKVFEDEKICPKCDEPLYEEKVNKEKNQNGRK